MTLRAVRAEGAEGGDDAVRGLIALHAGRGEDEFGQREAAGDRTVQAESPVDRHRHQRREIAAWAPPEGAEHLELAAHEAGDLDFRGAADGGDADHHASTAVRGHLRRLPERGRVADGLEYQIGASAVGEAADGVDRAAGRAVDDIGRALIEVGT